MTRKFHALYDEYKTLSKLSVQVVSNKRFDEFDKIFYQVLEKVRYCVDCKEITFTEYRFLTFRLWNLKDYTWLLSVKSNGSHYVTMNFCKEKEMNWLETGSYYAGVGKATNKNHL